MPCYHPLKGFRSKDRNPDTGKRSIVFSGNEGLRDLPMDVPCGQCLHCRLKRAQGWAVRCMHEASLTPDRNEFITLTYAPENLPKDDSLVKKHFQDFMKRLRRSAQYHGLDDGPIRYFYCGEYGETNWRPHYHALLFNFEFPDKVIWRSKSSRQEALYRSDYLEELWPDGFASIGEVTFASAAYVASYIMKKVTGKQAELFYKDIDEEGVVRQKLPEFADMSRRPGIGKTWFEKFRSEVFPDDFVIVDGRKFPVPKYYLDQFEILQPREAAVVKAIKAGVAKDENVDQTWERLMVREEVAFAKRKLFSKRSYENGT